MTELSEYSMVLLPKTEDKKQLNSIKLKHPKTDKLITILFDQNYNLFEIQKFSAELNSWLIKKFIVKDGSLLVITSIDIIFLFLNKLEELKFRNSKDSELGKFEEIEEVKSFCLPDNFKKSTNILDKLKLVCDEKIIPGMDSSFLRLNDSKVLKWLSLKVNKLTKTKEYHITEAIEIISEYLSESWSTKLYNHLNVEPVKRKRVEEEEEESIDSKYSKFKNNGKKATKPTPTQPAKKVKVPEKAPKGVKPLTAFFSAKPKSQ